MTVDCQWIEKNLEALFCGSLAEEDERLARKHIETCPHCREEVVALNAIDPLIKRHFLHEMAVARAPRRVRASFVYGGAAAALLFALMFAALLRTPQPNTPVPVVASQPQTPATAPTEPSESIAKIEMNADGGRTKPQPGTAPADTTSKGVSPVGADSPDFLVIDPAGYSRNLDYYRGHVLLIGVWSTDQPASSAALQRLYKTFGANTKLRLIGVTNERQAKAPKTTFPVVYNQGSKLFGAQPGEFVLIDEGGNLKLRGSLVSDFDALVKALR